MLLHATTIAFGQSAIMIRGKPGAGKSTLALELLETSGNGLGDTQLTARLVSDDQTRLEREDKGLWASPPEALRGKLEVRGLGVLTLAQYVEKAELVLVVDLDPGAERLPDVNRTVEILGLSIPTLQLPPHAGALASRVRSAFNRLNCAVAVRDGEA